ncbi:hypothetical protein MKZ38_007122 [Zalerion maritima]|uniref:Uncharacterized protein n=1 Tax=Zalerion maritima TaxID=339359 RepID=A0AAD5RIS6_9PEZI|nr:hypothetical protein MKZ38_007122 [Zalerion maritima]
MDVFTAPSLQTPTNSTPRSPFSKMPHRSPPSQSPKGSTRGNSYLPNVLTAFLPSDDRVLVLGLVALWNFSEPWSTMVLTLDYLRTLSQRDKDHGFHKRRYLIPASIVVLTSLATVTASLVILAPVLVLFFGALVFLLGSFKRGTSGQGVLSTRTAALRAMQMLRMYEKVWPQVRWLGRDNVNCGFPTQLFS